VKHMTADRVLNERRFEISVCGRRLGMGPRRALTPCNGCQTFRTL